MPQELPELTVESRTQNVQQIQSYMESKGFEGFDTSEASDAIQENNNDEEQPEAQAEGEEQEEAVAESAVGGNDEEEKEQQPAAAGKKPAQQQPAAEEKKPSRRARAAARQKAEMEAQRRQYEERFAEQQRKIEELSQKFTDRTAAEERKAAAAADPEPKYEDFADDDNPIAAYAKAYAGWSLREERRKEQKPKDEPAAKTEHRTAEANTKPKVEDQPAAGREQQAAVDRWNAQVEVGKATYDDWDQVLNRPQPKPICSPAMSTVIMNERPDDGADVLYWIATHPEEAHQMFNETVLGENPSQKEVRRIFDMVHAKFDALKLLADDQEEQSEADDAGETEHASREVREVATRPASSQQSQTQQNRQQQRPADAIRARQAAAAQQQPQSTPRPKMDPPKPLGSRSVVTRKSVDEMTKSDFARLGDSAADEYRRLRERR